VTKVAAFEKSEKLGQHMKPLFVKGYVEGRLVQRVMVNGGAGVNVMSMVTFEKLGYHEGELMKMNTSLSAFTGEVTETNGVLSVELTLRSKTLAAAFFVIDVKGCYDLLLGRDWIHANRCVPLVLHQCLIQWVCDDVPLVVAEDHVCIAMTEPQSVVQEGSMACLSGKDL
jgi:hypothetical protein